MYIRYEIELDVDYRSSYFQVLKTGLDQLEAEFYDEEEHQI